jgi:hypothetical protein
MVSVDAHDVPLQVFSPAEQLIAILHLTPERPGGGFGDNFGFLGDAPPSAVLGQPGDRNGDLEFSPAAFLVLHLRRRLGIRMNGERDTRGAILLPALRNPVVLVVIVFYFTLSTGEVVAIDDG